MNYSWSLAVFLHSPLNGLLEFLFIALPIPMNAFLPWHLLTAFWPHGFIRHPQTNGLKRNQIGIHIFLNLQCLSLNKQWHFCLQSLWCTYISQVLETKIIYIYIYIYIYMKLYVCIYTHMYILIWISKLLSSQFLTCKICNRNRY